MQLKGGLCFNPELGFERRDLYFKGDKITDSSSGNGIDVSGCYIIPGLTDLHFHGAVGSDFSDGNAEGLSDIADFELSRGVTQICPAGMTLLPEQLIKMCENAAKHKKTATHGAELVGINLEGPFLSYAKRGAQNGDWLQSPDIGLLDKLIAASEGLAKLITIAPELEGAMEFIKKASKKIRVSIGHTTADFDIAEAGIQAGIRQVTHLYNAMPPFSHRAPGVIGAAADHEQVMVELICDGVHSHPSVVRATFKLFGCHRIILISDTMRAVGLEDGHYTLGGQDVTVQGRLSTMADGTIAGSVTDLLRCLQTAITFGIPLFEAVICAAVNPAKALGIYDTYGSLDIGKAANFIVLDKDLQLQAVYFKGQAVANIKP